jgi:dihydrofolate reductase
MIADGKDIALATPQIIQQCLDRGLAHRVEVSVVPLLLGRRHPALREPSEQPDRA